jgi:hypothetical protein
MTKATSALSLACVIGCVFAARASAQSDYRNLEGGRPVRISDATPTERHSLELDLTTIRIDKLSEGRYRAQLEPRVSYGAFPRADVSVRALAFYREPSAVPRGTVAGVGIGGEYLLKMETLNSPAIGLAAEAFIPTGPNAANTAYSVKGLITRTFPLARVHLNGSYGSFSVRIPIPPVGSNPLTPPVVDGPCAVSPSDGALSARMLCMTAPIGVGASASAGSAVLKPGINTGIHWLAGIGIDKTLPLRSILIVGDVFAERYESIGRPTDWTAEVGGRTQVSPRLVADVSLGRHFSGISTSWFMTFGTTVSLPFTF